MNIAAAGALILFFSVLIATVVAALLVFSYAAYSFLVTLSNTAVGYDEVLWPGEPLQDWLFKVWYLGWLLALWAVPASFVASLFGLPGPLFALCVAALLWLMFPIGLFSSLSAESRLVVFRLIIVRDLLKHFGVTLRFYASSGLVVLVCGAFCYGAVIGLHFLYPPMHKSVAAIRLRAATAIDQPVILIPLAAVICAAGCLIYARLLGRTAFLISQSDSPTHKEDGRESWPVADEVKAFDPWSGPNEKLRAEEKPRPRRREQPSKELPKKKKLRPGKPERAFDPWAAPAEEPIRKPPKSAPSTPSHPEDPYGPAEGTYEVAEGESRPHEPPPRYSAIEKEEVEPYAVSPSVEGACRKLPTSAAPEVSKFEEELAAPRTLPPLPDWPLVTGVYSFPFYQQTIRPFFILAFGLLAVIALSRLLIYIFPI